MSLGFLISMGVKSSVIAGLALLAVWILRRRPATERVWVLRAATIALLALPALALALPSLPLLPAMRADAAVLSTLEEASAHVNVSATTPVLPVTVTVTEVAWSALLFGGYLVGVALLIAYLVSGLLTLQIWTGRGRRLDDPFWNAWLDAHAGGRRRPRLVVSDLAPSPMSWGFPPGVILLPSAVASERAKAASILGHELGHIRRGDWVFLVLSHLATAAFWCNPLVWLLQSALVQASEEAADEIALAHVDRETYARTLVSLAGSRSGRLATGMGGSAESLKRRIALAMSGRAVTRSAPYAAAAALIVGAGLLAPLAAVEARAPATGTSTVVETRRDFLFAKAEPPTPPSLVGEDYHEPPELPEPPEPLEPLELPEPPEPPELEIPFDEAAFEASIEQAADELDAHIERFVALHEDLIQRHAERAAAAAERSIERAHVDAERVSRQVERMAHHHAKIEARRAIAEARIDMRKGAADMLRGAAQMRAEADRLEDPAYRARQIARAEERGEPLTEQKLLRLIPELRAGADRLERDSHKMREEADQLEAP